MIALSYEQRDIFVFLNSLQPKISDFSTPIVSFSLPNGYAINERSSSRIELFQFDTESETESFKYFQSVSFELNKAFYCCLMSTSTIIYTEHSVYQGKAVPSYCTKPPLCDLSSFKIVSIILEQLSSTSIGAFGPPKMISNH